VNSLPLRLPDLTEPSHFSYSWYSFGVTTHKGNSQPVYSSEVFLGSQLGRTIGFPTLNLDVSLLENAAQNYQKGVYACRVFIADRWYEGALYFGPRLVLDEQKNVLEIFVINFSSEIYGQVVEFQLGAFIRPVMDFASLAELQEQLAQDVDDVRACLSAE